MEDNDMASEKWFIFLYMDAYKYKNEIEKWLSTFFEQEDIPYIFNLEVSENTCQVEFVNDYMRTEDVCNLIDQITKNIPRFGK
jgi:hypothetical protein